MNEVVSAAPVAVQGIEVEPRKQVSNYPNTVHFAIRMAALKSMRVVGCGVRGRNG